MYLSFKNILRFKEIEKDCERFLVQSKKKTIVDVVNIALANLKFHAVHATSEYICNICVKKRNNLQQILKELQKSMGTRKLALFSCWKIRVKWGWQPTRLLRFVTFFSFAVFFLVSRPSCRFTLVYEGRFILCYKEKLGPLHRAMANF